MREIWIYRDGEWHLVPRGFQSDYRKRLKWAKDLGFPVATGRKPRQAPRAVEIPVT